MGYDDRKCALLRAELSRPDAVSFIADSRLYATPAGAIEAYRQQFERHVAAGAEQIRIAGDVPHEGNGGSFAGWDRYVNPMGSAITYVTGPTVPPGPWPRTILRGPPRRRFTRWGPGAARPPAVRIGPSHRPEGGCSWTSSTWSFSARDRVRSRCGPPRTVARWPSSSALWSTGPTTVPFPARSTPIRLWRWSVALYGGGTGAAGVLIAAAARPSWLRAVFSRAGRPDLAGEFVRLVHCPTLLVVGETDGAVRELKRAGGAAVPAYRAPRTGARGLSPS